MEHPALEVSKIKEDLTLEEIQKKISEIMMRLTFAYRTQNQALINQLEMVRETYMRAYTEIVNEEFDSDENPGKGQIDIN